MAVTSAKVNFCLRLPVHAIAAVLRFLSHGDNQTPDLCLVKFRGG